MTGTGRWLPMIAEATRFHLGEDQSGRTSERGKPGNAETRSRQLLSQPLPLDLLGHRQFHEWGPTFDAKPAGTGLCREGTAVV